jgi:hypothetical protein
LLTVVLITARLTVIVAQSLLFIAQP